VIPRISGGLGFGLVVAGVALFLGQMFYGLNEYAEGADYPWWLETLEVVAVVLVTGGVVAAVVSRRRQGRLSRGR
jgi:hypothetical protein